MVALIKILGGYAGDLLSASPGAPLADVAGHTVDGVVAGGAFAAHRYLGLGDLGVHPAEERVKQFAAGGVGKATVDLAWLAKEIDRGSDSISSDAKALVGAREPFLDGTLLEHQLL